MNYLSTEFPAHTLYLSASHPIPPLIHLISLVAAATEKLKTGLSVLQKLGLESLNKTLYNVRDITDK